MSTTRPRVLKGKAKREQDEWNRHCDDIHHKKLAAMKPQIDVSPPETIFMGTLRDAKTNELAKARQAEVDRENQVLMSKLTDIGKGSGPHSGPPRDRSLNRQRRRQELEQINVENLRIVRKMQTVKGKYDHKKWEEENRKHEKLLGMICEFPPIRGSSGSSMGSTESKGSTRRKSKSAGDDKLPDAVSPRAAQSKKKAAEPMEAEDADVEYDDDEQFEVHEAEAAKGKGKGAAASSTGKSEDEDEDEDGDGSQEARAMEDAVQKEANAEKAMLLPDDTLSDSGDEGDAAASSKPAAAAEKDDDLDLGDDLFASQTAAPAAAPAPAPADLDMPDV